MLRPALVAGIEYVKKELATAKLKSNMEANILSITLPKILDLLMVMLQRVVEEEEKGKLHDSHMERARLESMASIQAKPVPMRYYINALQDEKILDAYNRCRNIGDELANSANPQVRLLWNAIKTYCESRPQGPKENCETR
jgi:hypothetical protein